MERMHSLLRRQIKRHIGDVSALPGEWRVLINAVNEAYREMDMDREILEQMIAVASGQCLFNPLQSFSKLAICHCERYPDIPFTILAVSSTSSHNNSSFIKQ